VNTRQSTDGKQAVRQAATAEMDGGNKPGNNKATCSTNAIALAITTMASVYTSPI